MHQGLVTGHVVRKLGPNEGRTIAVGGTRLIWKATGEDTGFATSAYEMELTPGNGIPIHSHAYAEIFYIISGQTDFVWIDIDDQEHWVRCSAGETLVAPINVLHAFHNRTKEPTRFISFSTYYHQVGLDKYGMAVSIDDPLPPPQEPTEADGKQYLEVLNDASKTVDMYFPLMHAKNGMEIFEDLAKRNL